MACAASLKQGQSWRHDVSYFTSPGSALSALLESSKGVLASGRREISRAAEAQNRERRSWVYSRFGVDDAHADAAEDVGGSHQARVCHLLAEGVSFRRVGELLPFGLLGQVGSSRNTQALLEERAATCVRARQNADAARQKWPGRLRIPSYFQHLQAVA